MRNHLKAFFCATLLFGGAGIVRADLIITASEAGFPTTQILDVVGAPASDLTGATSVNYGDFKINILGAEAATNVSPTDAELLSSSTKVQNSQFNSPGTHTLTLTVSATNYTTPTAPPALQFVSHIGGTVITPNNSDALTFQGFADPTDTPTTAGAFTPGPQSPLITSGSYDSSASSAIGTLGSPYAMLTTLTYTLGANSSVNYSSSAILSVPEPASIAFLSLGGVGLLVRRRRP